MVDGFWSGILGGLFGPVIAQWMAKLKYWVVFLVAMMATHIGLFIVGAYARGIHYAIKVTLEDAFTPVGILVPMGIGLLAVFVTFIGSLNTPKKPNEVKK